MDHTEDDDRRLIRYLLGLLPEEELEQVEERLFADDEFAERIAAVEMDLIDEYLRGELLPADLEPFERRLLARPGSRERVAHARQELRAFAELAREVQGGASGDRRGRSNPPRRWLGGAVLRYAYAATALIALAAGAWLALDRWRLQDRLARLEAERQGWQQSERRLRQELTEQWDRERKLADELQLEQRKRTELELDQAATPSSGPKFPSFVLPGVTRDPAAAKVLVLPRTLKTVHLVIDLEPQDDHQRYFAALASASSPLSPAFHSDLEFLVEPGGAMVSRHHRKAFAPGNLPQRAQFDPCHPRIYQRTQPTASSLRLERLG